MGNIARHTPFKEETLPQIRVQFIKGFNSTRPSKRCDYRMYDEEAVELRNQGPPEIPVVVCGATDHRMTTSGVLDILSSRDSLDVHDVEKLHEKNMLDMMQGVPVPYQPFLNDPNSRIHELHSINRGRSFRIISTVQKGVLRQLFEAVEPLIHFALLVS
ncbi:hypothetical protein BFJ69_g10650 [Fusarium oxysporum]|uniref:Uncharacterized protein n=1 Tax=Fusarium oxysporum TaxID=5507 RepID=A0A420MUV6_FUSOX|nr:hypothetical protein BFJ69_g10650 [Fusarium oxysporum]